MSSDQAAVTDKNDMGDNWNCHNWVYEAFRDLVEEGILNVADGATLGEISSN